MRAHTERRFQRDVEFFIRLYEFRDHTFNTTSYRGIFLGFAHQKFYGGRVAFIFFLHIAIEVVAGNERGNKRIEPVNIVVATCRFFVCPSYFVFFFGDTVLVIENRTVEFVYLSVCGLLFGKYLFALVVKFRRSCVKFVEFIA